MIRIDDPSKRLELKIKYLEGLTKLVESEKLSGSARESYAGKIKKISDSIDQDFGIR